MAVCLLTAFTIPPSLHADQVTIDYSEMYSQDVNLEIVSTVARFFAFDTTGTAQQPTLNSGVILSDLCIPMSPDLPPVCDESALPGSGFLLSFRDANYPYFSGFATEGILMRQPDDLTPILVLGVEGAIWAALTIMMFLPLRARFRQ